MASKLKYGTQPALRNQQSLLIPTDIIYSILSPPTKRLLVRGPGGKGVPVEGHLPIDFGSRFLTNSAWSPTCRMLYTLLFISSSWLYLRYCATFSETNTTLPSRFTTKKNPSRA